jgi:hypothetical protein
MTNSGYTRQRQGRDFTLLDELNRLKNAETSVEANHNDVNGIINGEPKNDYGDTKNLLEQLEYLKAAQERNAAPVDGHEPPERTR